MAAEVRPADATRGVGGRIQRHRSIDVAALRGGPEVPAGALGCSDGNVHLPENIGKEAAEFIMVEFKDRSTFRK